MVKSNHSNTLPIVAATISRCIDGFAAVAAAGKSAVIDAPEVLVRPAATVGEPERQCNSTLVCLAWRFVWHDPVTRHPAGNHCLDGSSRKVGRLRAPRSC
jgi:hypothetical protein